MESNKYQEEIRYLTQDIEEIGRKTWLAEAIASHLRTRFKELTREKSFQEVNLFFLREAEKK